MRYFEMGELWQAMNISCSLNRWASTHTDTHRHIRGGTGGRSSTSRRQRQAHGCSTLLQIIHCWFYHISPAVNTHTHKSDYNPSFNLRSETNMIRHCISLRHPHFSLSNRLSHQFIDLSTAVPGKYHIEGLSIWQKRKKQQFEGWMILIRQWKWP